MSLQISKASIVEHNFYKKLDKLSDTDKKMLEFMGMTSKEAKEMLPENSCYDVTFVIENAPPSYGILLKSTWMDGMYSKALTFDMDDPKVFECDDKFVLIDRLQMRLESLPISQELHPDDTVSLNVKNETSNLMTITTDDLIFKRKLSIKLPRINLEYLRPQKSLSVSKIHVEQGFGYENARKFKSVAFSRFNCLDVTPPKDGKGISSLESDPKVHRVMYRTFRNTTNPLEVFNDSIKQISVDLEGMLEAIKTKRGVVVENYAGTMLYVFDSVFEHHAYVIRDCILELKDISELDDIAAGIKHHEVNSAYIKIRDPDPEKLIQEAISLAIKKFELISKGVLKLLK